MHFFKDNLIFKISNTKENNDISNFTHPLEFLNKLTTNLLKLDNIESNFTYNTLTTNINIFYTAMLNPQGRFLMDMFVYSDKKMYIYVEIHKKFADNFLKKLHLFDIESEFIITLQNNLTTGFIPIANDYKNIMQFYQNYLLKNNEITSSNILSYIKNNINVNNIKKPTIKDAIIGLDNRRVNFGLRFIIETNNYTTDHNLFNYDDYRLLYKVPEGYIDMEIDKSVILEFDFENLNAISFNKGCYPGQELMARTKHLGTIRKKIITLHKKYFNDFNFDIKHENIDVNIFCRAYNLFIEDIFTDDNNLSININDINSIVRLSSSNNFIMFQIKINV